METGQEAASGVVDAGVVRASFDACRALHLALVASALPLVSALRVESTTDLALRDLTARVWLSSEGGEARFTSPAWTTRVQGLRPRGVVVIDRVALAVEQALFRDLRAVERARLWLEIRAGADILVRRFDAIELIPSAVFPAGRVPAPALAAFVLRDDPVVAEMVDGPSPEGARPRIWIEIDGWVKALRELAPADAPASEEVRAPRRLIETKSATALERVLVLAACVERRGAAPLVAVTAAGPRLGVWLDEQRPALAETDDPDVFARLVESGALLLVDASGAREERPTAPLLAFDVAAARRAGASPLGADGLDAIARARPEAERSEGPPPRLRTWKRRLLDLTMRNPLLNLRRRATSLPVCEATDLAAVEAALAAGEAFRVEARPELSPAAAAMEGALRARVLYADLPARKVDAHGKNAIRAFRSALDEGGVHTLFLALGVLRYWDEARPEDVFVAPVVLLPVVLRRSRSGVLELRKAEADLEINAALVELLRRDHGIDCSAIDAVSGALPGTFAALRSALATAPSASGWTVAEVGEIAVLSFSGFRMWRDLDHQADDLMRHPLVQRLVLGAAEGADEGSRPEAPVAEPTSAREIFCPLEADASQMAAVRATSRGRSFVLEGPPGTGKSQTIANLVANGLASGKSVLFVSQKRAALEVVHARLAALGLGPFVLELYSKKASKPEVVKQLREAVDVVVARPRQSWDEEAAALDRATVEVSASSIALHAAHPPGMSVYEAIAALEEHGHEPLPRATFDPARALDRAWIADAKAALADLGAAFEALEPGWEQLEGIRRTQWPKPIRDDLLGELAELDDACATLEEALQSLRPFLPDLASASGERLALGQAILEAADASPEPRRALLADDGRADAFVDAVEAARALEARLEERYVPALLEGPLSRRAAQLGRWRGVLVVGLLVALFVRWSLRSFTRGAPPAVASVLPDVERAIELRAKRDEIATLADQAERRMGRAALDAWGIPSVDLPSARALLAFAKSFRAKAIVFPDAIELACEERREHPERVAKVRAALAAFRRFQAARDAVTARLDLASGLADAPEDRHLEIVRRRAREVREREPLLRAFGAFVEARDACAALGLASFAQGLSAGEVPSSAIVPVFEASYRRWWIDRRIAEDPTLASFDGTKQRGRELRFVAADRALMDLCASEIRARVAARKPLLDDGAPPNSQAGILLRQLGRRAGFASPRQLFSECAEIIRQLKPCVLMSPQSVAQYLDPREAPFDLVVFDEASQVPTHEAIGAIARGKQVVVVGDTKQLPPTTFFVGQKDEDEPDVNLPTELESILDECVASGLPVMRLSWHYRSRHPSLIAFSNARYYGSRLQILPAAHARALHLGVSLVHVSDGRYDRGGSATNEVEARAVVAEVVRRLTDPKESARSLGIVTFSRAQQSLVEDLLDEARDDRPELEPFFDPERPEPVIVKNLESIQGDERDVVLFSIGYGPDSRGKMTANLGPLGLLGGERRLNVAVTRAREQLVVFTSFLPERLDLSTSAAKGLHDLKAFLESAARGGDAIVAEESGLSGGPIAAALARRLRARGVEVDLEVGVGRYRIDLAVKHRRLEGAYLLGIEVDGPRHARTESARDRERLRAEVLAGLGFRRMLRARALEWYDDPDRVVDDMTRAIEEVEREETAGTPTPAVALSEPSPSMPAGAVALEGGVSASSESIYRRYERPRPLRDFSWSHPMLGEVLADIVAAEGPISERLLGRRLAEVFGLKRAPSGLDVHADAAFAKIEPARRPARRGGFFFAPGSGEGPTPRFRAPDPRDPSTRRDIEDIAPEEIACAARDLVKRYGRMPREDLARAVAKRLGFRGLSRLVSEKIEAGIVVADLDADLA